MWVDWETYKNLQIFDPVNHPSSLKWSGSYIKEGYSLFSIFGKHCTNISVNNLRTIMSQPTNNFEIIRNRHQIINFCKNSQNTAIIDQLKSAMTQIVSAKQFTSYLDWPTIRGKFWISIYRTIYYCLVIAEMCKTYGSDIQIFQEIGNNIKPALYTAANHLENIIDITSMEQNDVFLVKTGFYKPLDDAKARYYKISEVLNRVTDYEFDSVPSYINKIYLIYVPEFGFLLVIPYWSDKLSQKELLLPNIEFKFTSNYTAYYKSKRCLLLDKMFGDPHLDIIQEETKIVQALRNYLNKYVKDIVSLIESIIELDCLLALGLEAKCNNFVMPEIINKDNNNNNKIEIINGFHPILRMQTDKFVKNDTLLNASTSSMQILCGPNSSGKTVYLKQVAIIAYMIHIGSFVPAESVKINLLNSIHSRMHTSDSIITNTSTLLAEFKGLGPLLRSENNSLVLLDEIGRCSSEVNSIAILSSIIKYYLNKGFNGSFVLISTHLYEIEECLQDQYCLPLFAMDFTFKDDEITYLYKLKKENKMSNFSFMALEYSCKDSILVHEAKKVFETLHTGEDILPICNLRLRRFNRINNFIKKMANYEMNTTKEIKNFRNAVLRYYYNYAK